MGIARSCLENKHPPRAGLDGVDLPQLHSIGHPCNKQHRHGAVVGERLKSASKHGFCFSKVEVLSPEMIEPIGCYRTGPQVLYGQGEHAVPEEDGLQTQGLGDSHKKVVADCSKVEEEKQSAQPALLSVTSPMT